MIYREEQHKIAVLKLKDNGDVWLLTTKHKPEMRKVAARPAAYAKNLALNVQARPKKRKPTAIIQGGPLKSSPENVVEKRNILSLFKLLVVI